MALLAFLSDEQSDFCNRDHIMSLLWGSFFPQQASQNLRSVLRRLRKDLGSDVIVSEGEELTLSVDAIQCDCVEFERLIRDGSDGSLERAVALYSGPYLDGLDIKEDVWRDWVSKRRSELQDEALFALVTLAGASISSGALSKAVAFATRAIEMDEFREDAYRVAMQALADLGRAPDALRLYERLEVRLSQEFGSAPSRETSLIASALQNNRPVENVARTRKPRIAVLPLLNMTGDARHALLAEGISDDIATELARFRDLAVTDTVSSFSALNSKADLRLVKEVLSADYFVQGRFRSYGNRFRLSVSLSDAESEERIWSERYDRNAEEIFAVLDELVRTVSGTLVGWLERRGREKAKLRPTYSLDAYEKVIEGRRLFLKMRPETNNQARQLFNDAWKMDPQYAAAATWLTETHLGDWMGGWAANPRACLETGAEIAKEALELDDTDCRTHTAMARAITWLGGFEAAEKHYELALELNPSDVWTLSSAARFYAFGGDVKKCLSLLAQAVALNPLGSYDYQLGIANFSARNYGAASRHLGKVTEPIDLVFAFQAASLYREGRHSQTRIAADNFSEAYHQRCLNFGIDPNTSWRRFLAERFPYRSESDMDHFLDALAEALELP